MEFRAEYCHAAGQAVSANRSTTCRTRDEGDKGLPKRRFQWLSRSPWFAAFLFLFVAMTQRASAAGSFTISVTPTSSTVTRGNSATYSVTVYSQSSFHSGVLLEVLNLPSGYASAGFSPGPTVTPAANGSTTSTLTIGTNGSTATGKASMTVRASSSGYTTQTQGISLTVNAAASKPGGFTLSAAAPFCRTSAPVEPEIDLSWGQASGATSYDLYRDGALYSPGIPTTITTFQNYGSNVVAGQTYTYFVRAKNSTGTTDSNAVPVSISSTVCVASSFTISVSPGSQTVTQGNSTTFAVTVQSLGGFNSGVLLEVLNLPTGYASAGFSPGSTVTPPANGSTTATLTVGTNTSTAAGAASMTVRASSSGRTTQTQGISLTVNPAATATPTFSQGGGTYSSTQSVTISDSTSGATIYYTTNGATPTTSSTRYTSPISVTSSIVIQAIATASGHSQSAVGSASYAIQSQAATPAFSPGSGTYSSAQSVIITDSTSGAAIYYTTNGAPPTTASTRYSGPIPVNSSLTIQAIAIASGFAQSAVGSASYTIQPSTATPTFNPGSGTYASAQSVSISDSTSGATIYYTTNGAPPTTSSTRYSGPIAVNSSMTIQAIATASGYAQSVVGSASYAIQSSTATPTFSPGSGTYASAQSVTISDSTSGATIYYTTNGAPLTDRKSTRLNSSHRCISYAVFC